MVQLTGSTRPPNACPAQAQILQCDQSGLKRLTPKQEFALKHWSPSPQAPRIQSDLEAMELTSLVFEMGLASVDARTDARKENRARILVNMAPFRVLSKVSNFIMNRFLEVWLL